MRHEACHPTLTPVCHLCGHFGWPVRGVWATPVGDLGSDSVAVEHLSASYNPKSDFKVVEEKVRQPPLYHLQAPR